jgi:hypothetical protein
MDQAYIRALVSGISYFVTGLPLSYIGDQRHFLGAHKKIARIPPRKRRNRTHRRTWAFHAIATILYGWPSSHGRNELAHTL